MALYKPRLYGHIAAIIELKFLSYKLQHCSRGFFTLNCEKLKFEIFVEDLVRDKLTAHSIFQARVKDHAVKIAEMVFLAIIFLPQ